MFKFIATALLCPYGDLYTWADSMKSRAIKLTGLLELVVE